MGKISRVRGSKLLLMAVMAGCLLLGAGTIYNLLHLAKGMKLTIHNQTGQNLTDLRVVFGGGEERVVEVAPIEAGKTKKIRFRVPEGIGESEMLLVHTLHEGRKQTEVVFGYVEPGYFGKASITVRSMDEAGNLQMEIRGKMFE
jgi:hypothetical protein